MDTQGYVQHARAVMHEHGLYLQGVGPAGPADPTYCYTVGLQQLGVPQPEVIVFGLDIPSAAMVLETARQWILTHGPLPVGETVRGLLPSAPRVLLRVDRVLPQWVATYAGMVSPVLRRHAQDVPMVQLVLADPAGRWPEDPAVSPSLLADQPLLSRDVCWRTPVLRTPEEDLFLTDLPATVPLAVPIDVAGWATGRYELLRATRLDERTARVEDVPWLADHLAVGDVVRSAEPRGIPGLPDGAVAMSGLLRKGPWATRTFAIGGSAGVQVSGILWELRDEGRTRLSTTTRTLHANTLDPADFDVAVRPFVRDGVLRPMSPHSELDLFPPDECPDCHTLGEG